MTPHDPDESVQGFAEKIPLRSVEDQVIIPVGGPYPVTVAVQVVPWPTTSVGGAQITFVELVAVETVSVVKVEVLELARLFVSPA